MKITPVYRIESLCDRKSEYHSCGFTVCLDTVFAERAFNTKIGFDAQKRFAEISKKLINYDDAKTLFVEDSALVNVFATRGNCACLGIDGRDLSMIKEGRLDDYRRLVYNTHNVDSKNQAFDLLTLFTHWCSFVDAVSAPS